VDLILYLCNNSSFGVKTQGVRFRHISGGKIGSYRARNITIKSSQETSHVSLKQKSATLSLMYGNK